MGVDMGPVDVLVAEIVVDDTYYPRTHFDWQTSQRYRDSAEQGAQFPPIALAKDPKSGKLFLIDGRHRLQMTVMRGVETIRAEILEIPRKQWLWESCQRNIAHGRQLSAHERIKCGCRLLQQGFSEVKVASMLGLPTARFRTWMDQRTTVDPQGDRQPVKASFRGAVGTKSERHILPMQGFQSDDSWVSTGRKFLDQLRAGVVQRDEGEGLLVEIRDRLMALLK
jgi:hypothetical protein